MLRINRQTDYAVRVVLALALRGPEIRLSSTIIQAEMFIPHSFIPRIVAKLANRGLVQTFTGRDGGLQLARPSAEITLKDVVEAFEGPMLLSECMYEKAQSDCPFQGDCQVRSKWEHVQAAMLREMASVTFSDLANEAHAHPQKNIIPIIML